MREIPLPYGTVLFCDDVRQEMGGKVSLVGVYNREMAFLPGTLFPVTLPKLGVHISWCEPIDAKNNDLTFQVGMRRFETKPDSPNDHTILEFRVDITKAKAEGLPADLQGQLGVRGQVSPGVIISPCVLPFPGILRAQAIVDGDIWPLGAVKVYARPAEPNMPPAI